MGDFAEVARGLGVSKSQKFQQRLKILIPKQKVVQSVSHVWCCGMDDMGHSMVVQNIHTVEGQETVDKYQNNEADRRDNQRPRRLANKIN